MRNKGVAVKSWLNTETFRHLDGFMYSLHHLIRLCEGFCSLDADHSVEFDTETHIIHVGPFLADGRDIDDQCRRLYNVRLRIPLDVVHFNKSKPFYFYSTLSYTAISSLHQLGIESGGIFYRESYITPTELLDLNQKSLLRLRESLKNTENFIFNKYYKQTRFFHSDEVKKFKKAMGRLTKKMAGVNVFDFVSGNLEDEYLNALRMVKTIKKFDKIDAEVHEEINKILEI